MIHSNKMGMEMQFEVGLIHDLEVYKDIARVPKRFRLDVKGKTIPDGRICLVKVGNRKALLSLRGQRDYDFAIITMDERCRDQLGVMERDKKDFTFRQVGWWGQFRWAWNASDPAYRIGARMGAIAILLGLLAIVLAIIPFFKG